LDDLPVSRPIKRVRVSGKTSERDLGFYLPMPSGRSLPPDRARHQRKPAPAQSAVQDLFTGAFDASLEAALEEALDSEVGFPNQAAGQDLLMDACEGSLEAALEEALEVAEDTVDVLGDINPQVPTLGMMVTLCGLMARPELNGVRGRLEGLNDQTGRWECVLDGGGAVNVKPDNFKIITQMGVSEKRAGPDVDSRRVRPRSVSNGVNKPAAGPKAASKAAPRAGLPRAARGKPNKLFGIW